MIGQAYSISNKACVIKFIGGPWHDKKGLYDHDKYDSIQVSDYVEQLTYEYRRLRSREYYLHTVHKWGD